MVANVADANSSITLPRTYNLGEYVIESVLGQGGFGVTYLARDTKLSTRVAIKEYFPQAIASRDRQYTLTPNADTAEDYRWGLEEFLKEARVLAKFKHNHIVRVLRFLEKNSTAYMVMEYEEGESLADYLRKHGGFLNESTLLNVFLPILSGLQAVHDAGLLHLDIKPDNIYLRTNGQPMLIDFGSAHQTKGGSSANERVSLTPGYSALEQYPSLGHKGSWTDVYGVGATLYRCITGKQPVDAFERYKAKKTGKVDPLTPATTFERPIYVKHIRECVDLALKLKAKKRPQTAAALQQGLMGQHITNRKSIIKPSGNYRPESVDISQLGALKTKRRVKRSFLEKLFFILLLLSAVSLIALKILVQTGTINQNQIFSEIDTAKTAISVATNKLIKDTDEALYRKWRIRIKKTEKTTTATLAPPLEEPVQKKVIAPFDTSKVLLRTLIGHTEQIESLAFLRNGAVLASASADGTVNLWNVETGDLLRTFRSGRDSYPVLAASPDGRWLARANSGNSISIWDTEENTETGRLTGHLNAINEIAFSPDGNTLASASEDRTVILWDRSTQKSIRKLSRFDHNILTVAFSPNGRLLATGDAGGNIKYWTLSTGDQLAHINAHKEEILSLAYSPDGQWLASGGTEGFLKLWSTGIDISDRVLTGAHDAVQTVTFSPDSKWLITGGATKMIQIWNIETAKLAHQLQGRNQHIYAITVSPDGRFLASGGNSKKIYIWK